VQSEQAAKALTDQTKAMRDMLSFAQGMAKQIKLISTANVEHSSAASALLTSVSEIRQITDRNAAGVKQTRGGTDDLLRRAQALITLVDRPTAARTNGSGKSHRNGR
jgi:methyl-accepting chemotaxis protein